VRSFVIAGSISDKARTDLKRRWATLRCRAGLQGVLRHSFASVGAGAGVELPMIGRLLRHTQASTTVRYAHLAGDPLRRASESISERIAATSVAIQRPPIQ
jgi:site-specific recombinase XerD